MEKGKIEDENPETDNAKTVETVLNYSQCPVCFETLVPQIYQCENGHIVCKDCIEKMVKCGECRVPLNQGSRIRNIALENICQSLNATCPNNSYGCGVNTTIDQLKNHLEVCSYQPVNFCSKFLKWTDCNHLVSDSSILSHLETDHSITKANSKKIRISFNGFELPLGECDILFAPLIVTSMTTPLLIRSLLSIDGWIAFTCFILESARIEDSKEFQVKFCIESQKKEVRLEWSGYAQSYKTFKQINIINSFRIPVESLKEFCEGKTNIIIKVDVWKTGDISLQEENVYEEVNLPGQETPYNPDLSSSVIFSTVTCDACGIDPIRNIRYKCLQCQDYDLCSKCMELRHHAHHIFARVQNLGQKFYVYPQNNKARAAHVTHGNGTISAILFSDSGDSSDSDSS